MFHLLLFTLGLVFLGTTSNLVDCVAMELDLDRFEQISGFNLIDFSKMRVRKFNRTTYVLDGEFELFEDLNDKYQGAVTCAYSALGNNQWNEYPFKISKDKLCNVFNGAYKEYQEYFVESTNLPRVGDDWLCPFPKGKYWVRNLAPKADWVPKVVPAGYWRLTMWLYDTKDEVVFKAHFFMKLTKGYF
ncbi:uncharacterized protein LOC131426358 [Malaya genurostris]|uniref:uncharacterized protein LOC131426358 n=1 Tax=Malaya genurostris TaxID=325434 RepID=UPI0026F3F775|nr:uncharacterized protein LOC131426358 [Malaya genurostris]